MKHLLAITIFLTSVVASAGLNETILCSDNWDCPDVINMGCCQGTCIQYNGPDKALCAETTNRPLEAICEENFQCGDSCCSQHRNICVAPLLDCQHQLPLWAFCTALTSVFILLVICWKCADTAEKARKKKRREKREEAGYIEDNSSTDRNTKYSGGTLPSRRSNLKN